MSDNGNDDTRIIGFQASDSEASAIDALAARNERSRSAELRLAMRSWLEQNGVKLEDAPKSKAAHVGAR